MRLGEIFLHPVHYLLSATPADGRFERSAKDNETEVEYHCDDYGLPAFYFETFTSCSSHGHTVFASPNQSSEFALMGLVFP